MIRRIRYFFNLLAIGFVFFPAVASACMVCIPFPEETTTDRLLQSDVAVFAREHPHKPFSFQAVEVLKGEFDDRPIDLFVDSTTRRRLQANPGYAVLLTSVSGKGSWRRTSAMNQNYQQLMRQILRQAPEWEAGANPEARAQFFIPYLASSERDLRELAYLEVGRASYETIRMADAAVPVEQIHRFLADRLYLEWQPLYILLLGVNASPQEAALVRETLSRQAMNQQTLHLSSWATALIEVDGVAALDWLETRYLGNPVRSSDQVVEVVKALSVQGGSGSAKLRSRIAESYAVLADNHPELSGWAARDLAAWRDWRFTATLQAVRQGGARLDGSTAYAIDYYLGRAASAGFD